ncbi:MAG TPA: D-alanyl-D-alanine carboxypeptidase/D-alanyl-D-alanine-endopeptidase [Gemmatimonadetes bacterium]|nr:D-alanyl-D-alanine carboxypeptidase/D-alanyl-D-alanine-endopeptidase [Gemmatimonadota bacterium]
MKSPALRFLLGLSFSLVVLESQPTEAQEITELQADLSQMLDAYSWRDARWGVLVVSLDQSDTLFSKSPDSALSPASNVKLLTTAAALRILGPDFRFQTYLLSDSDIANDVLQGDLVLYGTGDPGISDLFFQEREYVLELLADQLEDSGIKTVRGDLVADASHLPGPLRPYSWDPRDLNDHFAAPVSALSFNENVVSFRVASSGRAGSRPEVHTIPENAGLDVRNLAITSPRGTRPHLAILREYPSNPIRIEGGIALGARDAWRQMTVSSPPHFTASVFRNVLLERGIRILGDIRVVRSPQNSILTTITSPTHHERSRVRILAKHNSAPLSEYISVINKRSNNLFAELVFRTMGRTQEGLGSPEAGARAVSAALTEIGVPMEGVVQLDGSGLAAGNRTSAGTFVSLLQRMAKTETWDHYWASLPQAGTRRELRRMYQTAAAGNLRAKTGTIEGVSALSGIVRSRDEERLAFSILLNGTPSTTRAKRVENLVGARLAEFVRSPERGPNARVEKIDERTVPSAQSPQRYQIVSGDNLSAIAYRFGLTLNEMLRANPRIEPNRIVAGQWLTIPQRGGGS